MHRIGLLISVCGAASACVAQNIQLDYNWNGMGHAEEYALVDAEAATFPQEEANDFRSITDRSFVSGTADSITGETFEYTSGEGTYLFESDPFALDMVMIGTRFPGSGAFNDGGGAWDITGNSSSSHGRPTWDPTSPLNNFGIVIDSTTTFAAPIAMDANSRVSFLYHGSRGGNVFQVDLNFTDGTSVTVDVDADDFFADSSGFMAEPPFPGVLSQDIIPGPLSGGDGFLSVGSVDVGQVAGNLGAQEAIITRDTLLNDLGFEIAGKSLESITFDGDDLTLIDTDTSIGIYGLIVNGQNRQLNNNWNGLADISRDVRLILTPDDPAQYRSISDRGLDMAAADRLGGMDATVVSGPRSYEIEDEGLALDMIFVGNRYWNGGQPSSFDAGSDFDFVGTPPAWDPTGGDGFLETATTTLSPALELSATSTIGVLFHISRGGQAFDVVLDFQDGSSVTYTLSANDWFANGSRTPRTPELGVASQDFLPGPLVNGDAYPAVGQAFDFPFDGGNPLHVTEGVVTRDSLLSGLGFDIAGRVLTSVTFDATELVVNNRAGGLGDVTQGVGIYGMAASDATPVGGGGCNAADLAMPFNTLDIADVVAFLQLFGAGDAAADLAAPSGTFDIADVVAFLQVFGAGCP